MGKKLLVLVVLLSAATAVFALDFASMRKNMVDTQIRARGVKDSRVLSAMLKIPRHKFVPENMENYAYLDRPLPIGYEQTISQPYIVALMTELSALKGNEKVLEIGTGSGYQAAVLSILSAQVYSIEILKPLADSASVRLKQLGYENVKVKHGDGYQGWEEYAPFDVIVVTAAPDNIPPKLVEQLKEGGRMVLPVGSIYQELKLVVKEKGKIRVKDIIPVRFVPMVKGKE
ncbi:MAG TPA: protein-L-isoaspartate(D-aspartate) O-methyltransferase [Nitrospirae bacterium]|nr:protein-L-isoaspartate(D-aspartate) O-methyltransferase [Nitrospirota bacterium]